MERPLNLVQSPSVWCPLAYARGSDGRPDGQRFVMIQEGGSESDAPTQIHVVLNWFEELKRRVPTQ